MLLLFVEGIQRLSRMDSGAKKPVTGNRSGSRIYRQEAKTLFSSEQTRESVFFVYREVGDSSVLKLTENKLKRGHSY